MCGINGTVGDSNLQLCGQGRKIRLEKVKIEMLSVAMTPGSVQPGGSSLNKKTAWKFLLTFGQEENRLIQMRNPGILFPSFNIIKCKGITNEWRSF